MVHGSAKTKSIKAAHKPISLISAYVLGQCISLKILIANYKQSQTQHRKAKFPASSLQPTFESSRRIS